MPWLTFHFDGAAILKHQMPATVQSQPRPKTTADPNTAGFGRIERLKNTFVQMLSDTRSAVFNADADLAIVMT